MTDLKECRRIAEFGDGLGAVVDMELVVDMPHMCSDRGNGDAHLLANFLIGIPMRQKLKDLSLSLTQC